MFKILFAPLQGYTTAIYRSAHNKYAGGIDTYYTPFIRVENGQPRKKDLNDLEDLLQNPQANVVPQIIANGIDEFRILTDKLISMGFLEIDLNMGCPFPMQVKHHRGAGLLSDAKTIQEIANEISKSSATFSIKMRLGQDSASESLSLLQILNETPLKHITMHPRLGKQQYNGALDIPSFKEFCNGCKHRIFFNGEIRTVAQIQEIENLFPDLEGVMIGRGLLANPCLAAEYKGTAKSSSKDSVIMEMHKAVFDGACRKYQGDSQILSHLQSFWEYQESRLPKKIFKRIKKAGKLQEYAEAIAELSR